jgi:SulP family sulfate permease
LIAGFTVGVMLVPQEMSFSVLMGVPAQYGLYTATIAPLLYPFFGSSRALAVANTAEGSLLVGVMLRSLEIKTLEERIATGIVLNFCICVLMICSGLAKFGGVVSFFSRICMHGYVTGTEIFKASTWKQIIF